MKKDPLAGWIAFLASPAAPATAMQPLELEGFFAGLAVCPDMVPPSLWLDMLWGDDEPTFDDTEQVQKVLDSVMAFYNATLQKIDSKGTAWRPMYMDENGKADLGKAETWALGFWQAIAFEPEAWEELAQDERTQVLVEPFVLLMDIGEFDDDPESAVTDEIRRESAEFIPLVLPALRELARIRASDDINRTQRTHKIGRNQPCPCGSGKKYKRCCGAN